METLRFILKVWSYNVILRKGLARLEAIQQQKLRDLLRHTHRHSKFYRDKWSGLDVETCRLQDLPVVTKAELMADFANAVTDPRLRKDEITAWMADLNNIGKYYLGEYVVSHTSGSQGQSAVVVQDHDAPFELFAMQVARGHAMPKTWGTVFKKLFTKRSRWAMVLFKPCFIPSGAAFGYMPKASKKLADMLRLNLMDPFEDTLRKLDDFKPNFITAYVHVLEQLATAAKEGRTNIHKNGSLQLVIAISEPLPPETQRHIEEHLGVPVANHYAMGECPALSLGCPQGRGAHVNVDMAILENVDENYQPVPDGQPGAKVLVTNLLNRVQPFIRYEIDDVITVSHEQCSCGSPLPLVTSIAGRSNDQFWVTTPAGEVQKMSNFIFKDAFLELYDVAEYQVLQTGTNRFQVVVQPVPGAALTPERVKDSVESLAQQEDLPATLELEVQFVEQIPRDPKSGKVRRFINLVGRPDEKSVVVATS